MTYRVRKPQSSTGNQRNLDPYEISMIRRTRGLSALITKLAKFKRRSSVCDILSGRRPASDRFLAAMAQALIEDAQDRTTMAMLARYPRPETPQEVAR